MPSDAPSTFDAKFRDLVVEELCCKEWQVSMDRRRHVPQIAQDR